MHLQEVKRSLPFIDPAIGCWFVAIPFLVLTPLMIDSLAFDKFHEFAATWSQSNLNLLGIFDSSL
jgi:hypothetical protein